jgi:branched-chain amino acid transport system ATP-binding protein
LRDAVNHVLSVCNLITGYGKREVLKGVSVDVPLGRIVAVIGHNGAGKSTLLRAIFGLIPIWDGLVTLHGEILRSPKPLNLLRAGVAYIPQGNAVFRDLTVHENLEMGGTTLLNQRLRGEAIERAVGFFPVLRAKLRQRAGTLSGGEQQMLALSNALVLSPRLLLLDEPSLGLSPNLVTKSLGHIKGISRHSNVAVLIVEQKVKDILTIADYVLVLRNGKTSFFGSATDLSDENKLREVYL